MDKWDELTHRIQQSILAEEPEAAAAAGFQTIAEFGRTLETISADLDRIATALEGGYTPQPYEAGPEVEQPEAEPTLEHDL